MSNCSSTLQLHQSPMLWSVKSKGSVAGSSNSSISSSMMACGQRRGGEISADPGRLLARLAR